MEMTAFQRRAAAAAVSIATVAAMSTTMAPVAGAAKLWGAVAYSKKLDANDQTQFGGVTNSKTEEDAKSAALSNCGQADCFLVATFNACLAVAFDGQKLYPAEAESLKKAEQDALSQAGSKAVIDSEGCNDGYS